MCIDRPSARAAGLLTLRLACWSLLVAVMCRSEYVFAEADAGLSELEAMQGVRVIRYPVFGLSAPALRASLRENGPVDADRRARDGYTHWHIRWRWDVGSDGRPDFTSARSTLAITVTLPEWRDRGRASSSVQAEWDSFFQALVRHEQRHVDLVLAEYPRIEKELQRLATTHPEAVEAQAHSIGNDILNTIRARDRAYDTATRNGATEGVCLPLPCAERS